MKKSIFNIDKDELKEVAREARNTPFGSAFYLSSLCAIITPFVIFICDVVITAANKVEMNFETDIIIVLVGFFTYALMYGKWMQLVKEYYEEKSKK